jgi:hypothetical protein
LLPAISLGLALQRWLMPDYRLLAATRQSPAILPGFHQQERLDARVYRSL